jgi:aldehyde dehydrogenase (NAD+)
VQEETFAPILYVIRVKDLDDAIASTTRCRRACPSAIFTIERAHAERFLSATGSDCGIANVNIGTRAPRSAARSAARRRPAAARVGSDAWEGLLAPADEHGQTSRPSCSGQGIVFG